MSEIPKIRVIFTLTKKDCFDFDRDAVSKKLDILPTKSRKPMISKGRLTCESTIQEIDDELVGITILPSETSSHQMVIHAEWTIELPKIEAWSLDKPLQQMEKIFCGKEKNILQICNDYDLDAAVIIRIFTEFNNLPELTISSNSIAFWASMGASIGFDFYLDD